MTPALQMRCSTTELTARKKWCWAAQEYYALLQSRQRPENGQDNILHKSRDPEKRSKNNSYPEKLNEDPRAAFCPEVFFSPVDWAHKTIDPFSLDDQCRPNSDDGDDDNEIHFLFLWWSHLDSNQGPFGCKPSALPTELCDRIFTQQRLTTNCCAACREAAMRRANRPGRLAALHVAVSILLICKIYFVSWKQSESTMESDFFQVLSRFIPQIVIPILGMSAVDKVFVKND